MALIQKLLPKNRFLRRKRLSPLSRPTTPKDVEVGVDVLLNLEWVPAKAELPETVTLLVGEPPESIQMNRRRLMDASDTFNKLLTSQPEVGTVKIDNIRACVFRRVLTYIRTNAKWEFDGDFFGAFELLKTADFFGLTGLVEEIRVQFGKLPLNQNACKLFELFRSLGKETEELAKAALTYIEDNTNEMIISDAFLHLSLDSLCEILASDRLTVPAEIELFFAVMRWGQFSCSKTFQSVTPEYLRNLLAKPLQLIRFPRITPEDMDDFVVPSKLLSDEQVLAIGKIWDAEREGASATSDLYGFNSNPRNYYEENQRADMENSHDSFVSEDLPPNLQEPSTSSSQSREDPTLVEMLSNYKHHIAHLSGSLEKTQEELSETKTSLAETRNLTVRLQEQTTEEIADVRTKLTDTMKELHQTKRDLMETTQMLAATMHRLESTWKILHKKSALYEATCAELNRVVGDLNVTKTMLKRSILAQERTKEILAAQIANLEEAFNEDLKDAKEMLYTQLSSSLNHEKEIDSIKSRIQEANSNFAQAIAIMKITSDTDESSRRLLTDHDLRIQQLMTQINDTKEEVLFQMQMNRDHAVALQESREEIYKFKEENNLEIQATKEEIRTTHNVIYQRIDVLEERQCHLGRDFDFNAANTSLIEEVLKLMIAHPVPIGFLYTQFGHQIPPQELWPTCKWEDVTLDYAGLFFRACGGKSLEFGETQEQEAPRIDRVSVGPASDRGMAVVRVPNIEGSSKTLRMAGQGGAGSGFGKGLQFHVNGKEVRPRNQAVRIWRRY